jgi:predicted HNH restriction endonuclease
MSSDLSVKMNVGPLDSLTCVYVYCKRYFRLVLEAIFQHDHYGLSNWRTEQNKHTAQAIEVLNVIEKVANRVAAEEVERRISNTTISTAEWRPQ